MGELETSKGKNQINTLKQVSDTTGAYILIPFVI